MAQVFGHGVPTNLSKPSPSQRQQLAMRRLLPLLVAGQEMREMMGFTYISQDWDAAKQKALEP